MSDRFIVTKEHRRFIQFADAVRHGHTIGLCFGAAGVGTTVSASLYAHWDTARDLLTNWGPRADSDAKIYSALAKSRTVLYAPGVLTTPRLLRNDLDQAVDRTSICIAQHLEGTEGADDEQMVPVAELKRLIARSARDRRVG